MPTLPLAQLANEIEGFWTVVFSAGPNYNGGVAVFASGSVYGGDNAFFYVGSYSVEALKVVATLDCRAFTRNATNIFGTQLDSFPLVIEGTLQPDGTIAAQGRVPIAPHLALNMRLTKRCGIR